MTEADAASVLLWRARWRAIGWILLVAVVVASLLPLRQRAGLAGLDKLEHFIGYALLMFWFAALHAPARRPWIALAFVALGAALELAQGATGWRHADSLDLVANALGIGCGWLLAHLYGAALFLNVERATR
jgi:VanZ family protein